MSADKEAAESEVKEDESLEGEILDSVEEESENEEEVSASVGDLQTEDLLKEVAQLKEDLAKANDLVLRTRADTENVRRRSDRDLQNAHKFALEKFSAELLAVMDSLEMGLSASKDEGVELEKIQEGMDLTLTVFVSTMEKFGITAIDAEGEKFDPEFHEALTMVPTPASDPNTVIDVVQKGYLLNDRLLRPAKVIVSKEP